MQHVFIVFVGSGIGGVIRYLIAQIMNKYDYSLPIHTLVANMMACLILGIVIAYTIGNHERTMLRLFIAVGICGGMSTYSTFSYETLAMAMNQQWLGFLLYAILTFLLCLIMTFVGLQIGNKF